jgi:hypothetical protein
VLVLSGKEMSSERWRWNEKALGENSMIIPGLQGCLLSKALNYSSNSEANASFLFNRPKI